MVKELPYFRIVLTGPYRGISINRPVSKVIALILNKSRFSTLFFQTRDESGMMKAEGILTFETA